MIRQRVRFVLIAVFAGVVVAILSTSLDAGADVERFALLVGNDRGDAQDGPLKYAGADAERVREVLTEMGGFSSSNVVILRGESADSARRALIALNDRIRSSASLAGNQVVLFVYYSGHADAEALHLGPARLDLTELEQLVRGSAAQFRVLLVDACRSGTLTRTKGGTAAPPFTMRSGLGEQLDGQGVVFLTSSAASEDAQESDELHGSFFTHYFVSGLRGAADDDGDGRVELDEAYRYAYAATLRATSRTWAGTQHPTFRFEIAGRGRVVLTAPETSTARATLAFPPERTYLIFRGSASGTVIAEVTERAAGRRVRVRADHYFVRARGRDSILEGEVDVAEGQTVEVTDDRLHRIEYARLVRKGGSDLHDVHGPVAGFTTRTPLRNGNGLCSGAFAGYALHFAALSVTPRIDACGSGFQSGTLHADVNEVGVDVRLAHAWDFPVVTVDVGLTLGASWLMQSFTTPGLAPRRDSLAGRSSVGVGLTSDLGGGFYIFAAGAGETYLFRFQDSVTGESSLAPSIALRTHFGIGKSW